MQKHALTFIAATILLSGCSDALSPTRALSPAGGPTRVVTAQDIFQRYVALGTSNSMGVQSAGIFAVGQEAAWPAQLAARVGAPFSLPLVGDPGCGPPLLPPLAADAVLVGAFGNDLVTAVMNTCAPLQAGVTLPANSVAISGADVHDAPILPLRGALIPGLSMRRNQHLWRKSPCRSVRSVSYGPS